MTLEINKNISLWREFSIFDLMSDNRDFDSANPRRIAAMFGFNKERISIQGRWFDVITPSELVRSRNKKDGYYRVIYIQINMESGEYYIGKSNRPKWSELQRYQGSGLKFKSKFNKSRREFVRYFIAICETASETEQLEASIVTESLLSDEKCLNLVAGGGGVSERPPTAESIAKKRKYMKEHPEQFKAMLAAAKDAFMSGDTPSLRNRSARIKEAMASEEYREMTRARLKKWRDENPKEYAEARQKNRDKIRTSEVQKQRQESLRKWALENPEQHKVWQEKLALSRTSEQARAKQKSSLKKWRDENPEAAFNNAKRRAKAAAAKTSKAVSMVDLETGKVLREFRSIHDAARWLVENGITKNTNCVTSISSVCLRKPCTTGYGYRKKAYGFDWRFTDDLNPGSAGI